MSAQNFECGGNNSQHEEKYQCKHKVLSLQRQLKGLQSTVLYQ